MAESSPNANHSLDETDSKDAHQLRVCSFESRRAVEMRSLIERNGGIATVAPSMQEVSIDQNAEVFGFADALFAGQIDAVVFMTGVGAQALLSTVETRHDRVEFFQRLEKCCLIVRGPKPATVLNTWGVRIDHKAPEPNTWRELLDLIDAGLHWPNARDAVRPESVGRLDETTIAVQEYGQPNEEFYRELQQRGANVLRVPVYRWELPDDTEPLLDAIRSAIAGEFDVVMFTSANQLTNVLTVAESVGLREQWLAAAARCVVASIGPTASETIRSVGLPVDLEPGHPKMGPLVREALESAAVILASKPRT